MISEKNKKAANYIEQLLNDLNFAKPYYINIDKKWKGEISKINDFPNNPGIYAILRYSDLSVNPIFLYIGKATTKRSIKKRLGDHFGKNKPNVGGSQFCKILMQICQNEEAVMKILWSENTKICSVSMENEDDEMISYVEDLAFNVLKPKLNVYG